MPRLFTRRKAVIAALVAAGVALFGAANAHLIYVAVTSQPDCVAHLKTADEEPGTYRAAKPSC